MSRPRRHDNQSNRVAAVADAMQLLGHGLPLGHRWRHAMDVSTNEMGELRLAIPFKLVDHSTPVDRGHPTQLRRVPT
jgi:hypothetical protein